MNAHRHLALVASVILSLFLATTATAQWVSNGTPVLAETGPQYMAAITADGQGGAFVAGTDGRGAQDVVYVQRIDSYGRPLWAPGGVQASDIYYSSSPKLSPTWDGGCYVCMANGDIIVQRLDATGQALWGSTGVVACGAINSQFEPLMVPDGAGGLIVLWQDQRNGAYDLFAQRIDSDGNPLWDADGVPVCIDPTNPVRTRIAPDGAGGLFATWYDNRTGTWQVYVQHLDATGNPIFPEGHGVNLQPSAQTFPSILADGSGGVLVAFTQDHQLWLQRFSPDGTWLWGDTGALIYDSPTGENLCEMIPDEGSGYYLAWDVYRFETGSRDIRGQRIDGDGGILWAADGVPIGVAPGNQWQQQIVARSQGGFYATWQDDQTGDGNIMIQAVDPDGSVLLSDWGMALCTEFGDQLRPVLTTDGEGGVIVAWDDVRESDSITDQSAIYAQRVERNGFWGFPAPTIATVRDVPGDQGGQVFLAWDASRLDNREDPFVASYSVWRALDVSAKSADDIQKTVGPDLVMETLGDRTLYWQRLMTVDAGFTQTYAEVVPTLFDSTSTSLERHHFRVLAHGPTPDLFWPSDSDSCRSVDNLAPGAPQTLEALAAGPDINLSWNRSGLDEADLSHYVVFRGTVPGFIPDEENVLFTTTDTLAVDLDPGVGDFYYRVAAVDLHENEGSISNEAQATSLTGTGDSLLPQRTALRGNHPNPFNPSTSIRFDLSRPGRVELGVYDLAGRLVKQLIDGRSCAAGRHTAIWDGRDREGRVAAAGVYLYRLSSEGTVDLGRMAMVK